MNSVEAGRRGEAIAAAYLELTGHEILRRNACFGRREIDIIARRGRTIVFVEVKLRSHSRAGGATHAVNRPKQQQILQATAPLAGRLLRAGWRMRYEIIALQLERASRRMTLRHYQAPFRPPSSFTT